LTVLEIITIRIPKMTTTFPTMLNLNTDLGNSPDERWMSDEPCRPAGHHMQAEETIAAYTPHPSSFIPLTRAAVAPNIIIVFAAVVFRLIRC
jgi:hypothetical protein